MLCLVAVPIYSNAQTVSNQEEMYVDVLVPVTMSANSPLVGNAGVFNGFFKPGQTETTTNMQIFDWRKSSIPTNAKITKVEVSSFKTNVPGMTYYVKVGKGSDVRNINWAPNIMWKSKVDTSYFNNQNPHDYWALSFYAKRVITDPMHDYGAGATVKSATLRVYFK